MEYAVTKHKNHSQNLENDMRWIESNIRNYSLLERIYAFSDQKAYSLITDLSLKDSFIIPAEESFNIQRLAQKKVEELGIPRVSITEFGDTFEGFTPGEFLDLRLYYTLDLIQELAKQEGISLSDDQGEKPVGNVYHEIEEHLMKEEIPDKIEKKVFEEIEIKHREKSRLEKDMRWVKKLLKPYEPIEIDSKFYPVINSKLLRDLGNIAHQYFRNKDTIDDYDLSKTIPDVDDSSYTKLWLYRCVQAITNLAQRLGIEVENADITERRPVAELFEESKIAMKRKHLNADDVLKDMLQAQTSENEEKDALSDVFSSDNKLRSGITTEATKTVIADVLPATEKEVEGKVEE